MSRTLKIGDTVLYKNWSAPKAEKTEVLGLEIVKRGDKYGLPVHELDLDENPDFVVDLSNGHWAFSYQVELIAS